MPGRGGVGGPAGGAERGPDPEPLLRPGPLEPRVPSCTRHPPAGPPVRATRHKRRAPTTTRPDTAQHKTATSKPQTTESVRHLPADLLEIAGRRPFTAWRPIPASSGASPDLRPAFRRQQALEDCPVLALRTSAVKGKECSRCYKACYTGKMLHAQRSLRAARRTPPPSAVARRRGGAYQAFLHTGPPSFGCPVGLYFLFHGQSTEKLRERASVPAPWTTPAPHAVGLTTATPTGTGRTCCSCPFSSSDSRTSRRGSCVFFSKSSTLVCRRGLACTHDSVEHLWHAGHVGQAGHVLHTGHDGQVFAACAAFQMTPGSCVVFFSGKEARQTRRRSPASQRKERDATHLALASSPN